MTTETDLQWVQMPAFSKGWESHAFVAFKNSDEILMQGYFESLEDENSPTMGAFPITYKPLLLDKVTTAQIINEQGQEVPIFVSIFLEADKGEYGLLSVANITPNKGDLFKVESLDYYRDSDQRSKSEKEGH